MKWSNIHNKVWGKELWIVNNDLYCGKLLYLDFGAYCSYHYHARKDETFYVLRGKVALIVNNDVRHKLKILKKGDSYRLEPFTPHRFIGLRKSIILEVSTQHFEYDSYRLTTSGRLSLWKKFLLLIKRDRSWLLEI